MTDLKRIYTKHGVGLKLAKIFGCTPQMVSVALSGKRNTELAKKIRYTAVKEFGGVVDTDISTIQLLDELFPEKEATVEKIDYGNNALATEVAETMACVRCDNGVKVLTKKQ